MSSHDTFDPWQAPATLAQLEQMRRLMAGLNRRVVGAVAGRFLPGGRLLEIGSGGGQLRAWLPARLLPQLTHTEPSAVFLAHLRQRYPEAQVVQADAAALPFGDATQTAVVGLCAFDVLDRPQAARDEIRRVLVPGGVFVHFLDLGTHLEPVFADLVSRGELPLPPFYRDDALLQRLSPPERQLLPAADPFDDLAAARLHEVQRILQALGGPQQMLYARLAPYVALFEPAGFDASRAARAFRALAGNAEQRALIHQAFLAVYLTVQKDPFRSQLPLTVRSFASWRHLQQRLEAAFAPATGFTVEQSEVLAAQEVRPRDATLPADCRYYVRHVGKDGWLGRLPAAPRGTLVSGPARRERQRLSGSSNAVLVEADLYVFAARKRAE